jgi:hypothetical protein
MKPFFLVRLFVLVTFCLTALAIKSESSSCKAACYRVPVKTVQANQVILEDNTNSINYKSEIFFIKI